MEQSAFEAVMIGVNVFVFIIALTVAVLLMTNLLDMVDYANNQAVVGMNGTVAESVGVVTERTYTGEQLLTYYRRVKNETNVDKYSFYINTDSTIEKKLQSFIENNSINSYANMKFELQYKGKIDNKETYVFVKVSENT